MSPPEGTVSSPEPAGREDTVSSPEPAGREVTNLPAATGTAAPALPVEVEAALREIPMRVGAELGRATLPLAQAVDLGPGVVIELDRSADDPIDLCINGQRFATGQLLLVEEGEWAIRIERVFDVQAAAGYASRQGGLQT